MKKAEVHVGGTYVAKVSNKLTTVTVTRECTNARSGRTYWMARNDATGREITINSAARLRGPMHRNYAAVSGEPRPMDLNHGVPGDTPCICGGIAWYHGKDEVVGCDDCDCKVFTP